MFLVNHISQYKGGSRQDPHQCCNAQCGMRKFRFYLFYFFKEKNIYKKICKQG
uniref:Uncharacterized protein n=2 Tax=Anguilla anguilla TaxID=7936 RepID=A0A0E9RQY9_ANGAN